MRYDELLQRRLAAKWPLTEDQVNGFFQNKPSKLQVTIGELALLRVIVRPTNLVRLSQRRRKVADESLLALSGVPSDRAVSANMCAGHTPAERVKRTQNDDAEELTESVQPKWPRVKGISRAHLGRSARATTTSIGPLGAPSPAFRAVCRNLSTRP